MSIRLHTEATPATPASGKADLWLDSDGNFQTINDAGTAKQIASPWQEFSVPNVDVATFDNNVAVDACGLLYPPIPAGTIVVLAQSSFPVYYVAGTLSAVTLSVDAHFKASLRDATLMPAVTLDDFISASAKGFSINTNFATPSTEYSNSTGGGGEVHVGGSDDYGNTIVAGDELVWDFGLYLTEPKANQAGFIGGQTLYVTQAGG